jgi:hypothetical protein
MKEYPLTSKISNAQESSEVRPTVNHQKNLMEKHTLSESSVRIKALVELNLFSNPHIENASDEERKRAYEKQGHALDDRLSGEEKSLRQTIHDALITKTTGFVNERPPEDAIRNQKASLDAWIDYLSGQDAVYSPVFKYYAFTQITRLSQFDEERGVFRKFSATNSDPFPDVYRKPLTQLADIYETSKTKPDIHGDTETPRNLNKKFSTLYAELISKSLRESHTAYMEGRERIEGQWVKYQRGNRSDIDRLLDALDCKVTGWYPEGLYKVKADLDNGDFYVYYTKDKDGEPAIPRLAILMDGSKSIVDVRGVLPHQNVEPILIETLDEKLNEFGAEADVYRKKLGDMKRLAVIEAKMNSDKLLSKDDLIFLYEINASITGFGDQQDPRINELRRQRNPDEDMLVIFECTEDQIAHVPDTINQHTKVYVGELTPGIYKVFQKHNIEHIYTTFPEGRMTLQATEIGGMDAKQLENALEAKGVKIGKSARDMLSSQTFTTNKEREKIDLVCLSAISLGFRGVFNNIENLFKRAHEVGLEPCPPDTGPHYLLQHTNQPLEEYVHVGVKQITDSSGQPRVFQVVHATDGIHLNGRLPMFEFHPKSKFLFRPSQPISEHEESRYAMLKRTGYFERNGADKFEK